MRSEHAAQCATLITPYEVRLTALPLVQVAPGAVIDILQTCRRHFQACLFQQALDTAAVAVRAFRIDQHAEALIERQVTTV